MYMSGIQGINSNCIPYVRESQIICDNESTILWLFATLAVVLIIPRQLVMDKRRIYIAGIWIILRLDNGLSHNRRHVMT